MSGPPPFFNARLQETQVFLSLLGEIQRPRGRFRAVRGAMPDCVPILKACAFLLIYNLVESSVRSAFEEVYSHVEQDGSSFSGLTADIQRLWLAQQFSDAPPDSANRNTYLDISKRLANDIAAAKPLSMDARKRPISGNLDADQIRELCRRHGSVLSVSKWAKGGVELGTVKIQRNALAHGLKSFVECGREYEITDLRRILLQTTHFLKGFLASVDRYQKGKHFLST